MGESAADTSAVGTTNPTRTTSTLVVLPLVALALVLAACSSRGTTSDSQSSRPDVAAWMSVWNDTRALIPSIDALGVPPDTAICEQTVVDLRTARQDLYPTPDDLVTTELDNWMAEATSIFFECFESDIGAETVTEGYAELTRLEAEVTTAIDSID